MIVNTLLCFPLRFLIIRLQCELCDCLFYVLCSHKKKVLEFLDQLCSFYERTYLLASSATADSTQAFIDKVCEFAEANGLSSKVYRASLPECSKGKVRKQLNKVYN